MTCDEVKTQIALFLYGELSFQEEEDLEAHLEKCGECSFELERERSLQRVFDFAEMAVPPGMAAQSRRQLMASIAGLRENQGFWHRLVERSGIRWRFVSPALQPIGALALLALGYLGARVYPWQPGVGVGELSMTGPVASHVRTVEPGNAGQIRIMVEEARQRVFTGRPDSEDIRKWLVAGTQDPSDPGLRVESVNALAGQADSQEVRSTLLWVLQHDSNAGVRLKALEGLKSYAGDPATRQVLSASRNYR